MKKKGFTLVEMLGVILLLGILALIAVPTVNSIIRNNKEKALNETIRTIEDAAYHYSNNNDIGYSSKTQIIQISELKESGLLKNDQLINPETGAELEGCILYRWDDNYKQYNFTYDEECEVIDFTVEIKNKTGEFNENGWANKDFYVSIETNGTSYNYCVSDKKCSPKQLVENSKGTADVTLESDTIYVCAYANYKKASSETICSEVYKLDKTAPTAGTIAVEGTKGENEWYVSDVTISAIDGTDELSGHASTTVEPVSITENTAGKKVIVTTTDKADNVSTREYTIKVDKDEPTVTLTKKVENNKNVIVANTNSMTSGYSYEWYKDGEKLNGETNSTITTTESGKYKVKVTTGSGKSIESNELEIKQYTITYDMNGGTCTVANQTKIEDITINLATPATNCRDGYIFQGWGTSKTDKTKDYDQGAIYSLNENITLYAIWKKSYTYTFVENGATLSRKSISCDIYNAETSCEITTPTITRDGYDIVGFNQNKDAKEKEISHNAKVSISDNKTYYAITKKVLIAKFDKNTVYSISTTSSNCTIYNTETSCKPTLPTITPQTNFKSQNWGTSANQTNTGVTDITLTVSNTGTTWYALNSRDLIWNFDKNTTSAVAAANKTCTIWSTSGTCNIITPVITAQANFTKQGYGTSAGATSSTIADNTTMTLSNSKTGGTYYALNSRDLIWNFDKNATSAIAASNKTCTIWSTSGTCNITTPIITPTSGYTEQGYGTSASATSATVADNATMTLNNTTTGGKYYAIQSKTITITYAGNGATSGSTAKQTCTMYNSNTACPITLNSNGFLKTNYDFVGWGTDTTTGKYSERTSYNFSNNTTLYAIWKEAYNGIPNKDYEPGDIINYEGIEFIVVSDNGDTVTLVTKYNVSTGAYGTSATFAGSTAYNYVNTTWVNANSGIQSEITKGGIVKDSYTNSYVRLLKNTELSSKVANASNTNFWTLSSNGSNLYYGLPNGTNTYTKYTASANTSGTCYSGSSTSLSSISSSYNKNTVSSTTANASTSPSSTSAVTSTNYSTSASGTCNASYTATDRTVAQACNCTGSSCSNTYACTKTTTYNTTLTTGTRVVGSNCNGYNCTKYSTKSSVYSTSVSSTPCEVSGWCTRTVTSSSITGYGTTVVPSYNTVTTGTSYGVAVDTSYNTVTTATNYGKIVDTIKNTSYKTTATNTTRKSKATKTSTWTTTSYSNSYYVSSSIVGTYYQKSTDSWKYTSSSRWCYQTPPHGCVPAPGVTTECCASYRTSTWTGYSSKVYTTGTSYSKIYITFRTERKTSEWPFQTVTEYSYWTETNYGVQTIVNTTYNTRTTATSYGVRKDPYYNTRTTATNYKVRVDTYYNTKTTATYWGTSTWCAGSAYSTRYCPYNTVYPQRPYETVCIGSTCAGYNYDYAYDKETKQVKEPYTTTCGSQSSTCSSCETCNVQETVYTASGSDASWNRYVVTEKTNPMGYRSVITVRKK